MTSVELAVRLVRDLDVKSLPLLSSDGRLDLVTAMNSALQKHHALSPDHLKITEAAVTLDAPATISLGVTKGSSTFTGWTPTEAQKYATLRIATDDNIDHKVVSDTELLDEYLGETGTQQATVYYNAVNFYQPIERVVSPPRINYFGRNGGIDHGYELVFTKDIQIWQGWGRNRQRLGRPQYYTIEKNAINNGAEVVFSLRVDCLPTEAYRMRMDVQMAPVSISFDDLVTPVDLNVRDEHIESALLPIARAELTSSPLWQNPRAINRVLAKGEQAEQFYKGLVVSHPVPQFNRVGTPAGW